jgi:hypothetical protein
MCRFGPTGLVPAQRSGSCRSAVVGQLDLRVRAALHDRCRRGAHAPESLGFVACSVSREGAQATFVRAARAHRPGAACVGYRACYRHPFGCCRGSGGTCGAPSAAGWKASRDGTDCRLCGRVSARCSGETRVSGSARSGVVVDSMRMVARGEPTRDWRRRGGGCCPSRAKLPPKAPAAP